MKYPTLHPNESTRQMVDAFKGYNHNLRIGDGEFFDMRNMTSDHYPVLSPRGTRGVYASPEQPGGLIAKDSLCYVDGTDFIVNKLHKRMVQSHLCVRKSDSYFDILSFMGLKSYKKEKQRSIG